MMSDNKDVKTARSDRSSLSKEDSVTMEYFLQTHQVDAATAELLKSYDKSGTGNFTKDEVISIILDLREAMQSNEMLGASNKLFKRLFFGSILFCILLLASMFGLSYAVAAITAKVEVEPDGLMRTKDGKAVVATDSRASMFQSEIDEVNGLECVSGGEMYEMLGLARDGRNVLLASTNGTKITTQLLTGTAVEHEDDGSVICFGSGEQRTCFTKSEECLAEKRRRSLQGIDINSSQCNAMYNNQLNMLAMMQMGMVPWDIGWTTCMSVSYCSATDTAAWLNTQMCKCGCFASLNGFSKGR